MRRVMAMVVAVGTVSVALGGALQAQAIAPNQFAIDGAIGFAVPVGDYGTGLNTGLDLMGALEFHPRQTGSVYFRAELGWSHFGVTDETANSNITRFAVDGLYDFSIPHSLLQPYALAGVGIYNVSTNLAVVCGTDNFGNPIFCTAQSHSSTGFGINLGGGLRYQLGRAAQAYFEARYHLPLTGPGVLSDSPFLPFQFGVRYLLR